ncbi:MAG: MFS transporter [Gammaproteobacteria bacterium]|jgi:GPH family glycoside/pentoside/hexuronide:cation symporter|nr:MFS transporter [Gammaproteobacteria bacterium]HJP03923.1 MFS transporter [Gammaproteobacteria bacterium]
MSNNKPEPHQLTLTQQLGWATGSLGTAIMLGGLTTYAMVFMTNYLGISAAVAGWLIGLSKFYDLITDPLIAQVSDRTKSGMGRRRPYLLAGAVFCPLALVLLFAVPDFDSHTLLLGWLAIMLLVYATGFTLFNVPYLAMAAEITSSKRERTLIMAQRIFFSTLGVLTISALGPELIELFGKGVRGYQGMSQVLATVVCFAMLLTFATTRRAPTIAPSSREAYGLKRQIRLLAGNRPFLYYVLAKIFMFLSQSSVQVVMIYFAYYLLGSDESILQAFGVGYTVGSVLTLPLWNYLISGYLGKRNAFMVSALGLGTVFLSWLLAGEGEATYLLYIRFGLLGVFSAGSQVAASSMLPDIMEYDRKRTGLNQEGLYAAAFSVVEKVANTLGPIVLGSLLGLTGYVAAERGEFPAQPDAAITVIQLMVSVIPFAMTVLAAWCISKYTLSPSRDELKKTQ